MTVGDLQQAIEGMRVRVLEHDYTVRIEVPRSLIGLTRAVLDGHRPVHVRFIYAPLAWWRCWFVRQQFIREAQCR